MLLLLKKYFLRIVRLHLCNISLKIVDRQIWQWMWTVVIFQVTMKLRTTGKQISSCWYRIQACIKMEKKILCSCAGTNTFHTQTHTHKLRRSIIETYYTYTQREIYLYLNMWNNKCIETRTTANERNSHCQVGPQIMPLSGF